MPYNRYYDRVGGAMDRLGGALERAGQQVGQQKIREAALGLQGKQAAFDIGLRQDAAKRAEESHGLTMEGAPLLRKQRAKELADLERANEPLNANSFLIGSKDEKDLMTRTSTLSEMFANGGIKKDEKGDLYIGETKATRGGLGQNAQSLVQSVLAQYANAPIEKQLEVNKTLSSILSAGVGGTTAAGLALLHEHQKGIIASEAAKAKEIRKYKHELDLEGAKYGLKLGEKVKKETKQYNKDISKIATEETVDIDGNKIKVFDPYLAEYLSSQPMMTSIGLNTKAQEFKSLRQRAMETRGLSREKASEGTYQWLMSQGQAPPTQGNKGLGEQPVVPQGGGALQRQPASQTPTLETAPLVPQPQGSPEAALTQGAAQPTQEAVLVDKIMTMPSPVRDSLEKTLRQQINNEVAWFQGIAWPVRKTLSWIKDLSRRAHERYTRDTSQAPI